MPTTTTEKAEAKRIEKALKGEMNWSLAKAGHLPDGAAKVATLGRANAFRMALNAFTRSDLKAMPLPSRLTGTLAHFAFEFADPQYPAAPAIVAARGEVEEMIEGFLA